MITLPAHSPFSGGSYRSYFSTSAMPPLGPCAASLENRAGPHRCDRFCHLSGWGSASTTSISAHRPRLCGLGLPPAADLEDEAGLSMRSHQNVDAFLAGRVGNRLLVGTTVPETVQHVIENQPNGARLS